MRRLFRLPLLVLPAILAFASVSHAQQAAAPDPAPAPPPLPHFARARAETPPNDPYQTFRYRENAEPEFFRAIFEGFGVLSLGYVEYLVATHQIGDRVFYESGIFYDKVSGSAQSFDANQFGTNFLGHPLGGTLYYLAARSNRLSIPQSFAWALTGSFLWEYFGEIRERPSVNDMIATPWGGFANAETFTQFATFFARGRPTVHGQTLEILFGLQKTVHDAIDGLHPESAPETDALGFPTDIWHDFRARAGAGATMQSGARRADFDARLAVDLELMNLPDLGRPGRQARLYDDGNIARMTLRLAQSEGRIVDGLYETKVSPIGYYVHDARIDGRGRLRGSSNVVGLTVGYEYGAHDYDRDRRRPVDVLAKVSVLGLLAEHVSYFGATKLRARLELDGDFAGVRAYGLASYLERHPTELTPPPAESNGQPVALPFVLRNEGYYFGIGPSISPSVSVEITPALEVAGRFRWDEYRGILGLDVDQRSITRDVDRADRRLTGSVRATVRPTRALELGAEGEARRREGTVGDARAARSEQTVLGFVGARF